MHSAPTEVCFDALGDPVQIGRRYVYTTTKGSFVCVVEGTLIKINKDRVTLSVDERREFVYGRLYPHNSTSVYSDKVSIRSILLVPNPKFV